MRVHQRNHPPGNLKVSRVHSQVFTKFTLQVMNTKGVANQSCAKTWPSGQTNVKLNPTGGADAMSKEEI